MSTYNLYRISTRDVTFYVIASNAGEATFKGREVIDEPAIAVTHVALDGDGMPHTVSAAESETTPTAIKIETEEGDKVELEWTLEITETWKTTADVDSLVEIINRDRDDDYDELPEGPITDEMVRAALANGTFVETYGGILARDGGALPDWEDDTAPDTTVYAAVNERDLEKARYADGK